MISHNVGLKRRTEMDAAAEEGEISGKFTLVQMSMLVTLSSEMAKTNEAKPCFLCW